MSKARNEFLILCPDTDKNGGMYIADIVHKAVSQLRVSTDSGVWHGSVSIGIAVQTPAMTKYDDLIKKADEGVYAAKQDGKNCVRTLC